ncbi:MAG: hypothetical protein LBD29_05795 [Treponema sp.]|nr:hypothetical protein [Treponema sp.]
MKIKITEYFEEAETEAEYFYSAGEAPAAGSNFASQVAEQMKAGGAARY